NDWTLYSAIGMAYDQKDDFANSKLAYDRALLLAPGEPAVLNNYAMSRMLAFRKSVPPKGKIHAPSSCRGGRGCDFGRLIECGIRFQPVRIGQAGQTRAER
ncbi:MAG: hypothetical protein J0H30_13925, partial [Alphaproteobacteria bacterium]|nr:hypothetical protein [Alphaproteobacteria bacterium]